MLDILLSGLLVSNQILNAGNAITAFALMLYALTFNLRERVAQTLALLLACVTVVYFGDVLTSTTQNLAEIEVWLRLQWLGIAFVPATYLHLSDTLLAVTGRPSRWRRKVVVWLSYALGVVCFVFVGRGNLLAKGLAQFGDVYYLQPGPLFPVFLLFVMTIVGFAGVNFWRSYQRCLTRSSRRRMWYLMLGSFGPLIGSFPFMMILGRLPLLHPLILWGLLLVINVVVPVQMVLMSYSVAYFGVSFPDRIVKSRLFQWILRGPVVASTVLAVTVIVNRLGVMVGLENSRAVPFAMVAVLLLLQYVITLVRPVIERWFFYGEDRGDVRRLQLLEERLLTTGDVRQFLESVLNAACDITNIRSAFAAVIDEEGLELEVTVGPDDPIRGGGELPPLLVTDEKVTLEHLGPVFFWNDYWLFPLKVDGSREVVGMIGLYARSSEPDFSQEEQHHLATLFERAMVALSDRLLQREVFRAADRLVPEIDAIQRLRAASRYGGAEQLVEPIEGVSTSEELFEMVRDALGHYWGGPRLTRSPLMRLHVVQMETMVQEGNPVNALRAILKRAIERIRPMGERRFTPEWMLYNILEMKFVQGRKVREVAMRLAMSEADLYRKQRVAIEEVARAIADMEREAVTSEAEEASS
jgi:hypothetical protein